MKNFLAIDTSSGYLCVVASKNGEYFTAFEKDATMKHSVLFMAKVDEVLTKANLRLDECDFFAACVGAGSFTGIRIGISAAKGFALAHQKPTLAITSFDIAAYNGVGDAEGDNQGKILSLVDAMHGYYYACGYDKGEVCLAPAYLSGEEVRALAREGYALRTCTPLVQEEGEEKLVYTLVSPEEGLKNAVEKRSAQGAFAPLEALYIRKSSAEENLGK